jgi:transcriptional regulator with GAF, ATPase, and Fis domain
VRVIAATNRDLEQEARAAASGRPLYRLNVFPISVSAPARAPRRRPLLAAFFPLRLAKRLGKPLEGFSRRSMQRLTDYRWPGNIRELQNVVERAAILSAARSVEIGPDARDDGRRAGGRRNLEEVERRHIASVLRTTRGVIEGPSGGGTDPGSAPNTLRSRMKKLGVGDARTSRIASRSPDDSVPPRLEPEFPTTFRGIHDISWTSAVRRFRRPPSRIIST